ncbi:MAG: META domain-containing protein [Alphaproteobacteria bacterium]|nr:META domain-containing protein [Alphaproteobacteria bacterium]
MVLATAAQPAIAQGIAAQGIAAQVVAAQVIAVQVIAQAEFPYERDLVLDARPMRGGKRVPILSIDSSGRAQIDLWCKRGQGQAVIAGDTITVLVGAMRDEPCSPERAQADEEMLAALSQVTNWSQRGETVTFTGGNTTLRFRAASN